MNLEGLFFHTFEEDGEPEWQGVILGKPDDVSDKAETQQSFFLVQLFDWVTGEPSAMRLVTPFSMADPHRTYSHNWTFYPTRDEWLNAGRDHQLRNGGAR